MLLCIRNMVSLTNDNITKIFGLSPHDGVGESEFEQQRIRKELYEVTIANKNLGFISLGSQTIDEELFVFCEKVRQEFSTVVVLGIGGSMLGPKCVAEALYEGDKHIIFLDNIDPYKLMRVDKELDYESTLFLVQSKSGQTPETVAQFHFFEEKVRQYNLPVEKHFVFVTDPENGYLRKLCKTNGYTCFDIPQNVGGRFSVLSNIGLLLAGILGLDIQAMLDGAKEQVDNSDMAFKLAVYQYLMYQKGKGIHVVMPYSSRLKTFAEWSVQLISESLGKIRITGGEVENVGITPLVAVGATDQHSQLQLFQEGPKDKLIIFIEVLNHQAELVIPQIQEGGLKYLSYVSFERLLSAEMQGVENSLTEVLRPNLKISIEKVDEFNLGGLFMLFEMAVAYLGEMMDINAFDQPGVEKSKKLTKQILM